MSAAGAKPLSETLAWTYAHDVAPVPVAPGVSARSLWWDETGRHAAVVELEPQAALSRSTADDVQLAIYVISGGVIIDGRHFGQGAFVYCPGGREGSMASDEGALLVTVKLGGGASPFSWQAHSPHHAVYDIDPAAVLSMPGGSTWQAGLEQTQVGAPPRLRPRGSHGDDHRA